MGGLGGDGSADPCKNVPPYILGDLPIDRDVKAVQSPSCLLLFRRQPRHSPTTSFTNTDNDSHSPTKHRNSINS